MIKHGFGAAGGCRGAAVDQRPVTIDTGSVALTEHTRVSTF